MRGRSRRPYAGTLGPAHDRQSGTQVQPVETESVHHISMNLTAFAFTAALSLLTGAAVGLLPALRVSSLNLSESFKGHGRTSAAGAGGPRLQRGAGVFEGTPALVVPVRVGFEISKLAHP